jgi:hypothetical protein
LKASIFFFVKSIVQFQIFPPQFKPLVLFLAAELLLAYFVIAIKHLVNSSGFRLCLCYLLFHLAIDQILPLANHAYQSCHGLSPRTLLFATNQITMDSYLGHYTKMVMDLAFNFDNLALSETYHLEPELLLVKELNGLFKVVNFMLKALIKAEVVGGDNSCCSVLEVMRMCLLGMV